MQRNMFPKKEPFFNENDSHANALLCLFTSPSHQEMTTLCPRHYLRRYGGCTWLWVHFLCQVWMSKITQEMHIILDYGNELWPL